MMYFVDSEQKLLDTLKTLSAIGGTVVFTHEQGRTVWHVQGDKTEHEARQLFRDIGYTSSDYAKAKEVYSDMLIG